MNFDALVRKTVKEAIEYDEYEYEQLEEIICSLDRDITPSTFDRVIAEVMDDTYFIEHQSKYNAAQRAKQLSQ